MAEDRYKDPETGHGIPSVTEVISAVLTKSEYFYRWKFKDEKAAEEKSQEAQIKGTRAHATLEALAEGRPDKPSPDFPKLIEHGKEFLKGKRLIGVEKRMFSAMGFAGTPDLIYELDKKIYLDDYKTGRIDPAVILLQLGGYRLLVKENLGISVDLARPLKVSTVGIRVPKAFQGSLASHDASNQFLSLLDIYYWMKGVGG